MKMLHCEGSRILRISVYAKDSQSRLIVRKEPAESTKLGTTVAVVVLLQPVWRRVLFEDLATAKHGVSLLCRDGER